MAGSSFGKAFHITTFGESHGPGIGVVIQGCPPGLPMDESLIQKALNRRKPGQGVGGTKRRDRTTLSFCPVCFRDRPPAPRSPS